VQLFDRAYGRLTPIDQYWLQRDGALVDPFRPQVEPDGFTSEAALNADKASHFSAVREMFESLNVMVFTLGLTEAWRCRADGAVFPIAPGVTAGEMNLDRYEFVNFTVSDVVSDMQAFISRLLNVNPRAKMLLTVSPVPLIATYENRHVLVSTTHSKSVLRAAADEIARNNAMCDYFPSYEIITGNYNKGGYFESDLRSVKPEGVEHVMGLFLKYYSSEAEQSNATPKLNRLSDFDAEQVRENAKMNDLICDEEALDPTRS
jgi:GSCFA family